MKDLRLKRFAISIFIALSLAVSSFAAPLCACFQAAAKTHDCCEKMKMHCPMNEQRAASLDKTSSSCACSAEKRENTPTKITDNVNARQDAPALASSILSFILTVPLKTEPGFFTAQIFTEETFLKQTSARAPPRL
jgi:hypothetical protein